MNVRERLLSTGEYHCQECGAQLGKDDDVVPVPAYSHKNCSETKKREVVVEMRPTLTPEPPRRAGGGMSKEEREEFKRWKAERKEDGDDHGQDVG